MLFLVFVLQLSILPLMLLNIVQDYKTMILLIHGLGTASIELLSFFCS